MIRTFTPVRTEPQAGDGLTISAVAAQRSVVGLVAGCVALLACLFAALLLVLAHFDAVELPGCGTVSDCTRAAESRWGSLPGTEWPLSFVGFTYFQALVATFIYGGGRLPKLMCAIIVVGAVVSMLLIAAMFVEGYICGYCLAIHVLNFAFAVGYAASRWRSKQPPITLNNSLPSLAVFAATFLATSLLLAVVDQQMIRSADETRAEQFHSALSQARAGTNAGSVQAAFAPGRYYLGPKTAPVHVVVVSDYQCPSCRTIDAPVAPAVAGRDDISISARHFPFCTDCNEHIDKTAPPERLQGRPRRRGRGHNRRHRRLLANARLALRTPRAIH